MKKKINKPSIRKKIHGILEQDRLENAPSPSKTTIELMYKMARANKER